MNVVTDDRAAEYFFAGHPERPLRLISTQNKLKSQTEIPIKWFEPVEVEEELIRRAHSPEHIARVKKAEGAFTGDTPAYPNIFEHARRSVGGALKAMELARKGEPAFSLMRPPGHHAKRNAAMGFCYLNSIAIAALEGLAMGVRTMGIFDFDVHHGNGTEEILLNHPHAAIFSVHAVPWYPGTGSKNVGNNSFNYPIAPRLPRKEYRTILARALHHLKEFGPDLIGVSAGFDAFSGDPLGQEILELEDYHWLGHHIRRLGIPVFSVLEGGYSEELPELVFAYLKGLEGK